ncbi:MAG: hypothetical protein KDK08_08625 [Rhizobiaceae bacterium]|nr:hypothetical protein [Rhizobiaceae bacterium]
MRQMIIATLVATASLSPAHSQEDPPALALELNAVQPSQKGCRLTFVVKNGLGTELSRAAFEVALFNDLGVVDRLTVLDFRDLPSGKTKVARFELAGTDCSKVTRVLINGATDCKGDGVATDACMNQLRTTAKAKIEFGL